MLTPEGLALLWSLAAGQSQDTIPGWKIVVSDGTVDAETAVASFEIAQADDGAGVTLSGVFGEAEANLEWAQRRVVSGEGVVVDVEDQDLGRKAPGTVWGIDVSLDMHARPAGE